MIVRGGRMQKEAKARIKINTFSVLGSHDDIFLYFGKNNIFDGKVKAKIVEVWDQFDTTIYYYDSIKINCEVKTMSTLTKISSILNINQEKLEKEFNNIPAYQVKAMRVRNIQHCKEVQDSLNRRI